jgi:membrane-bound metal-dependent hydrolase YbcI (DUF457 family)
MDIFTHMVFGALMYILFLKEITFSYLIYAIVFSILPDLDIFLSPLRRKLKSNYLEHRSGSHSYIIGIILSTIIGGIYSIITQESFFIVWIIGIIFYGIHVSLDLLNTTKIPCFYPLSKKEYCFNVEKAGSSFTLITSWIFITSLLLVFYNFPDINLLFFIINFYTYFTIIYYIYRISTKIWVISHLQDNQKYLPGILPFYYYVFEKNINNTTFSFQIEKRSHFFGSTLIHESKVNLSPQEMMFFKLGLENCLKDYYFAKWTLLPVFIRSDGSFSVKFFFLEPMVHSRALFLQFDFNTNSKELVSYNQSFGRLISKF